MRKALCKMQLNVHNICKLDYGGDPMRDTVLKHCSATGIKFHRYHVHNRTNKSNNDYLYAKPRHCCVAQFASVLCPERSNKLLK